MAINKVILMILLALLSGMKATAQDFKFGFLAGLDVANSRLTNIPDTASDSRAYYPLLSFNVNGYIGYKSASFWGISIEPGFIQKGGVIRYDKDDRDDDVRLVSNYVQIPVLADFYLTEKFYASTGIEFAYMINTKAKSGDLSNDITEFYDNPFEISAAIGINYNIIKGFDTGLRYTHGLTYTQIITFTNASGEPVGEGKVYNQYFQFLVKYHI